MSMTQGDRNVFAVKGARPDATPSYTDVLNYYAKQMQAMNARDFEGYVATFTPDGVLDHTPGREPGRTREGILADLRKYYKRFDDDPQQLRHLIATVAIEPQDDQTIHSTYYVLIVTTRPGGLPELVRNCVVRDELVVIDGALLTRTRIVDHDGLVR